MRLSSSDGAGRAVAVAAVAGLALVLAQCAPETETGPSAPVDPPETLTPETEETAETTLPAPLAALSRAEIIAASARAAADYAAGRRGEGPDPLVGRSFEVIQPFGCTPPAPAGAAEAGADGLARVSWADERRALRLELAPGDWTGSALIGQGGEWEAIEGFWIARPWLAADSCPAVRRDPLQAAAPAPTPQTVGLAAVHPEGGSRLGRRAGRAFGHTVQGEEGAAPAVPAGGYRLVLGGRVVGFPDGRATRCRADGPDQRPVCVTAVQLDRVAFTTPDGTVLSEWRPG